jgi:hypothetical protein
MRAIAANQKSAPGLFLGPVGVAQDRLDAVGALGKTDEFDAAFDSATSPKNMVGQNGFGCMLWDHQKKGIGTLDCRREIQVAESFS